MFTDKIAIVTGAGRGIGKEIAKTLAAKGALVIVNYCGSAKRAEEKQQAERQKPFSVTFPTLQRLGK